MKDVSKKELRQRWLDVGSGVTDREAKGLVRQGVYTGHDCNLNLARLIAYRAGVAEARADREKG